jgi:hypothetical protein
MMPCTSALRLRLTVFAWLRLAFETVEVRTDVTFHSIASAHALAPGKPSEVHSKCLEEVQTMSRATLFSPVTGAEAVQAMSKRLPQFPYPSPNVLQYWSLVGLTMDG